MALVLANIGESDVQTGGGRLSCKERRDHRMILEDMLEETNLFNRTYPIMESIEKYLIQKKEQIDYLVLFYTEQKEKGFQYSDTNINFEIIKTAIEKKELFSQWKPRVIGYCIREQPYSYDRMYHHYRDLIIDLEDTLYQLGIDEGHSLYVSVTAGTPACTFSLIHSVYDWKEYRNKKTFLYSPRPSEGEKQPPAREIQVDTFLSVNEILNNFKELFDGHHYGQIKSLLNNLNLISNAKQDVLDFLDALLLRKNQQYQSSVQKLNSISNQEMRKQRFFKDALNQVRILAKGKANFDKKQSNWLTSTELKYLLEEQYWKIENYYELEQYNEWATVLMTYYEILLKLKTITLLGSDRILPDSKYEESLRKKIIEKVDIEKYPSLKFDDFIRGNNKKVYRFTYQKIIEALDSKTQLRESSAWVKKLNVIYEKRNKLIHSFGGLDKDFIQKTFAPQQWNSTLKQILKNEFNLNISNYALYDIHEAFIEWIKQKLHKTLLPTSS